MARYWHWYHVGVFTSILRATFKATLFLLSVALLAGGVTVTRGQSVMDGFDPNANNTVRDVLVQADGKILISGNFTTLSPNFGTPVTRNHIARLNSDGTLDTDFNPNANDLVYAIALQADGKILAGGLFTNIGGQARNHIARLDPATGLADSFDPNANSEIYSITVQSNGRVLAGGLFTNIGGTTRNHIARLDSATGLADSFDPSADNSVVSIVVQADGKILAGGAFTTIGGQARNRVARFDPATGLADSFDPNANSVVWALAVQADGKVLAGGNFTTIGGQARNRVARFDPATGLADSFDPNANSDVYTVAIQADGQILVGGSFNDQGSGVISIGGAMRNFIARLDSTTGLADSFNPKPNNGVNSIAVQADGSVLVGGYFTSFTLNCGATTWRNRVARLIATSVNSTPTPAPTPTSTVPGFVPVGSMQWPRFSHTATRLVNGRTLILGGLGGVFQEWSTAELFDPVFQTFTSLCPNTMTSVRREHTATLLRTGQVLITGGANVTGYLNTAELFDPILGQFTSLPPMSSARWGHTATLLLDGRVFIAGGNSWNGVGGNAITNTAELFDPVSATFASLMPNTMTRARDGHTATLLSNGTVLIAGGYDGSVTTSAAEVFDPLSGTFSVLPNAMTSLRLRHTATLLTNGEVLIAGGSNGSMAINTAELFDPPSGTFIALPLMNSVRYEHAATLLESGRVLVTGGAGAAHFEELFNPGGITLSGTIFYCSNPVPGPVPNVTLTLTDNASGSAASTGSGNYTFAGLASGGSYTVTPTKVALTPGSAGITTIDVLAVQRHFLNIGSPLTGCKLTAADVNGDTAVNTLDVIAIQHFYLGYQTGTANAGVYQFSPASRSYPGIVNDQADQNYDTLVFGDVASPFVE